MLRFRLLPALALIAVSLPGLCQTSSAFPAHERVLWDQPAGGAFMTTEIARLNIEHGNSVFVLRQNQLVMAYAPHVHEYLETVATTAYGFAVRRGTGPDGLDQIVYSDGVGLKVIQHDASGTSLYETLTIFGASSLAGSKALTCCDLDGNGTIDIVGVDATGSLVRTLLAPITGPLTPGPTISSVAPIRDLEPIQWSASPGLELALLSDAGTAVFDSNGAGLMAWYSPTPDHSMTVIGAHAGVPDRLVIAQRPAGGGAFELAVHEPGASDAAQSLGSIEPVNLDAGDFDGDGDDDVAMNYDDGTFVRVLNNTGGVFNPIAPSYYQDVRVSDHEELMGGGPLDKADPCLADVDDDGLAEVIMGSKTSGWIAVRETPPYIESDSEYDFTFCSTDPECMSPVVGMTIYNNDTIHDRYSAQGTGVTSEDTVAIELTVENMFGQWNPNIYNAIELILWEQGPGTSASVAAVTGDAHHVVYGLTTFASGDRVDIGFSLPGVMQAPEQVVGGAAIPGVAIPKKYYAEVRLVLVDANNEISEPLRTYVVGLTGDLGTSSNGLFSQILGNSGACQCAGDYDTEYSWYATGGGIDPPDATYIGGFAPLAEVPPLTSIVPQLPAFLDATTSI